MDTIFIVEDNIVLSRNVQFKKMSVYHMWGIKSIILGVQWFWLYVAFVRCSEFQGCVKAELSFAILAILQLSSLVCAPKNVLFNISCLWPTDAIKEYDAWLLIKKVGFTVYKVLQRNVMLISLISYILLYSYYLN